MCPFRLCPSRPPYVSAPGFSGMPGTSYVARAARSLRAAHTLNPVPVRGVGANARHPAGGFQLAASAAAVFFRAR
ncbi:hypothetical protein GCM10010527_51370 [Streptomyces drozdowiczii]